MRKNFIAAAACLMAPAMLLSALDAYAVEYNDLGELKIETDYQLDQYKAYRGVFTSGQDGFVIMKGGENAWFSDAEGQNRIEGTSCGYLGGSQPAYYYPVSAGTPIYFIADFTMNATTMYLYMAGDIRLLGMSLEAGDYYTPAGYGMVDIDFSEPVTLSDAEVFAGDKSAKVPGMITGSTINLNLKDAILNWLIDGTLKGDDEIRLRISGIKGLNKNLYNGDGILEVTYKSVDKPAMMTGNTIPETFMSYYVAGDPDGIFTMTFDSDMWAEGGTATLGYGNPEGADGEYYVEEVPYAVNGKTVTLDMTGKRRSPADMVASGTNYGSILLLFSGMRDAKGNLVWSDGSGTVGGFSYGLKYNEVKRANIFADFTPKSGESLNGEDEINVYMTGVSAMKFDGFLFTYGNGEEALVSLADCRIVEDKTNDGAEYTFAVPEAVKGKSNIHVTLSNLVTNDGYDHSQDVRATYDAFVLTYTDPKNGAKMKMIEAGTIITVETNMSEQYPEMYIMYEVIDMNPANPDDRIVKTLAWMNRQEDGSYTAEVAGNTKLLRGHTYHMVFTAWESENARNYGSDPIGEDYIILEGDMEPYRYSPIKLTEVTPVPGEILGNGNYTITMAFDGTVTTNDEFSFINTGMGSSRPFESITPLDPNEYDGVIYATKWAFTCPASFIDSLTDDLYVAFKFKDEDGLLVKGPDGIEETTCFMYVYGVANKYADFNVEPADGSVLESISEIVLSADGKAIGRNYNITDGAATLMNMQGGVVAKVAKVEEITGDDEFVVTSLRLVLDETVTEPGRYVLYLPESYVNIGEQFEARFSMEKYLNYTIENETPAPDFNVTADPAAGNVDSLEEILLTFNDYYDAGAGSGKATLTMEGGEGKTLPDPMWGAELNQLIQPLGGTITDMGKYTVAFPEGYFLLNEGSNESPAFELVYYVGMVGITTIGADENGRYEVYTAAGVNVLSTDNVDDLRSLENGFYIINGVKTIIRK